MFYSSGYGRQLHLWFEVQLCGVGEWQAQLAAPVCASACFWQAGAVCFQPCLL